MYPEEGNHHLVRQHPPRSAGFSRHWLTSVTNAVKPDLTARKTALLGRCAAQAYNPRDES